MEVSFAKSDITPEIRGISMLGYGNPKNVVKGVETPIMVRGTCFKDEDDYHYFILNYEICFITDSLYSTLNDFLKEQFPKNNYTIHLSAQHTHSAPSGYDYYALYNMPTPGFVPEVFEKYIEGAKIVIKELLSKLGPGEILFSEERISLSEDVSFNRSMEAYLNNPEVKAESLPQTKRAAVDKNMQVLSVKRDGKIIGSLNWFAVHATNIPNTNFYISPDNKGYAANKVEAQIQEHVALFNQGCAGDVSPNFIKQGRRGARLRGKYANPFDSARYNGELQAQHCLKIIQDGEKKEIKGKIFSQKVFRDLSDIRPYKEFLPPEASDTAKTSEPCHGVAFIQGTKDGPGIPHFLGFFIKLLASFVKMLHILLSFLMPKSSREKVWSLYRSQFPKSVFVNAGEKSVLGISDLNKLPIPGIVDPLIKTMKGFYQKGALRELTWVQKILPVQLTIIDKLVIATFPGEVTTIAGRRMRHQIKKSLGDEYKVIISPYSNAFCGYITTPEEYEMQLYEGGHTLFGKWTLPAFQSILDDLLKAYKNNSIAESVEPPIFSAEEITLRTYQN